MKRLTTLFFVAFSNISMASPVVSEITRYSVEVPAALSPDAKGFPIGLGSGLTFSRRLPGGQLEFFMLTDRGPNYPAPTPGHIVAFAENFSPKIFRVVVDPHKSRAKAVEAIPITYKGKAISGFDTRINQTNQETIVNRYGHSLPARFGLDTESLARLPNKDFVVGDEYGPSINFVDHRSGAMVKRFLPGKGLPDALAQRRFNRGFEALCVGKNNRIYVLLEGTLALSEQTAKTARFIRMLELDPSNGKTRMFAYPIDFEAYSDSSQVKIGDLAALDENQFLLVEQGKGRDGLYRNKIYKIDLSSAENIAERALLNKQELEFSDEEELHTTKMLTKSLLFDPRRKGWHEDKLEGLTVIDHKTIAISNDNDFGIKGMKQISTTCGKHLCSIYRPILRTHNQATQLWIIRFDNTIF